MGKKKSKKQDQEDNFQPPRSKSNKLTEPLITKNRSTQRPQRTQRLPQQKKKPDQPQRIPVYNQMRIEDRRAQQQKYRQSFLQKKAQQQKRGLKSLKYDQQANSQQAEIDEDSVERRCENETIRRIKEMLEAEELSQNKQHLHMSAENQYAKVQKLTESLSERHSEYTPHKEHTNKQAQQKLQKLKPLPQQQHKPSTQIQHLQLHSLFPHLSKEVSLQQEEDHEGTLSIVERIEQLEQVYYC